MALDSVPMRKRHVGRGGGVEIEIVGVVDHEPGVGAVRQRGQFGERRAVAVHREHAFGDDQRALVTACDAA